MEIPLHLISPNPRQPRRHFDAGKLDELAASLRENGQIQPATVEDNGDGTYTLIAGERRWRAAKLAGLETLRADVRPPLNGAGDQERLLLALVENLNREDMNPIEEARAFEQLREEFGLTLSKLGLRTGKGSVYVANRLILLRYEPEIQALIARGEFSADNQLARELLRIPDSAARLKLVRMLVANRASLRASKAAAQRVAATFGGARTGTSDDLPEPSSDVPDARAFRAAYQKTGQAVDRLHYDALVHTGNMPMWPLFKKSVQAACNACAWHDAANAAVCGDCPVVHLVQTITGRVNGHV